MRGRNQNEAKRVNSWTGKCMRRERPEEGHYLLIVKPGDPGEEAKLDENSGEGNWP